MQSLVQYGVVGAVIVSFTSILTLCLNRVWKKKDEKSGVLAGITSKLQEIETKLDRHIASNDEDRAIQSRVRILRSNDDILHNCPHTKEYWDSILLDITRYDAYCEANPLFRNDITKMAVENIRRYYKEAMLHGLFL